MAISQFDDYPIHQVPEPIRLVGTSDRNFYDRYYFNMLNGSDIFAIFSLGVYPNLGVMDAFASIRRGDDYRVVRASKPLGADRGDTSVGPIRLEVLEGLKRLRFVLDPNEHEFSMDVTWEAASPAYVETHKQHQRDGAGRTIFDSSRFWQTGRWSGELSYAGEVHLVDPASWCGSRDRSWGIRPIGDPEPERANDGVLPQRDYMWNAGQMIFDDHSILYVLQENGNGERNMQDAVLLPHDGSPVVHLGRPEHELEFISGTREIKRATIRMQNVDGSPLVAEVEPLVPSWVLIGTGYGQDGNFRHGKPMGGLYTDSIRYNLSDPADKAKMQGIIDSSARFRVGDHVGYGMFEYGVLGANKKYGFTSPSDVAP